MPSVGRRRCARASLSCTTSRRVLPWHSVSVIRSAPARRVPSGRLSASRPVRPASVRGNRRRWPGPDARGWAKFVKFIDHGAQLRESLGIGRAKSVDVRPRPVELALCRQVSSPFGGEVSNSHLDRRTRLSQFGLKLPSPLDRTSEFVAVDESSFEPGGLILTPLSSPVSPNSIGIRPPLPRPPTFPRHGHALTVTKRNGTVHQPGNSL